MVTTLPIPIAFRLPPGWGPVPPDDVGASGAAFVALHGHADDGFTANITIDGHVDGASLASLASLAERSIRALRDAGADVTLTDRSEVGSPLAPGLTQTLTLHARLNGAPRQLVQSQVYLEIAAPGGAHRAAVIRLVLTATLGQHAMMLPDFQSFVWTVGPEPV